MSFAENGREDMPEVRQETVDNSESLESLLRGLEKEVKDARKALVNMQGPFKGDAARSLASQAMELEDRLNRGDKSNEVVGKSHLFLSQAGALIERNALAYQMQIEAEVTQWIEGYGSDAFREDCEILLERLGSEGMNDELILFYETLGWRESVREKLTDDIKYLDVTIQSSILPDRNGYLIIVRDNLSDILDESLHPGVIQPRYALEAIERVANHYRNEINEKLDQVNVGYATTADFSLEKLRSRSASWFKSVAGDLLTLANAAESDQLNIEGVDLVFDEQLVALIQGFMTAAEKGKQTAFKFIKSHNDNGLFTSTLLNLVFAYRRLPFKEADNLNLVLNVSIGAKKPGKLV